MRYAVFGDIHGNLHALNAVMAQWHNQGVNGYLCVGDIVGYGAHPNECTKAVMDLEPEIVAGNHDRAAVGLFDLKWFNPNAKTALEWTAQLLGSVEREYLKSLPLVQEGQGYVLVHGTLDEPEAFTYMDSRQAILRTFHEMEAPLCCIGHTHAQGAFFWKEGDIIFSHEPVIELVNDEPCIVNPGSVGQPRDKNWHAAYCIFDNVARRLELYRVPYDLRQAQEDIRRAGLPEFLAERLAHGQ